MSVKCWPTNGHQSYTSQAAAQTHSPDVSAECQELHAVAALLPFVALNHPSRQLLSHALGRITPSLKGQDAAHDAEQLTAGISCPLTTSFGAGLEGGGEAAPAGPSAVAGMAKRSHRVAQVPGPGVSHGASAPAEQQQQSRPAAAQPAASNAIVASAKVRGAKRKAPVDADLAGPSAEEHLASGVHAAGLLRPHLDTYNPAGVGRQQCMHIWSLALPALCTSGSSHQCSLLKVVHAVQSSPIVHLVFLLFPNCGGSAKTLCLPMCCPHPEPTSMVMKPVYS